MPDSDVAKMIITNIDRQMMTAIVIMDSISVMAFRFYLMTDC